MTLNIKLVLDFIKVNLYAKFCVRILNGLAVRALTNWQTERQKHGNTVRRKHSNDSITSTADAGGNNPMIDL